MPYVVRDRLNDQIFGDPPFETEAAARDFISEIEAKERAYGFAADGTLAVLELIPQDETLLPATFRVGLDRQEGNVTAYLIVIPFEFERAKYQYVRRYGGQMHDVTVEWLKPDGAFGGNVGDPSETFGEAVMNRLFQVGDEFIESKGWDIH